MNQVILVGKVKKLDKYAGILTIEVKRVNEEGVDLIPLHLNEGLNETVRDYIGEGITIGVKATLRIDNNILRIKAEQVTFIEKKE